MTDIRDDDRRDRAFSIATALAAILSLGVAAAVLEATPIAPAYDVSSGGEGSGASIMAALLLLLEAVLSAFGVEFDPAAPVGFGSRGGALMAVLIALRSIARPLLGVAVLASVVLLVGRRVPKSSVGPIVGSAVPELLDRGRSGDRAPRSTATGDEWPPAEPGTDVAEAWVAMTAALEVDRPRSRTPEEWADAAVDAGFDEEAVRTLTELFSETRYGDATETAARRRTAKRERERLAGDSE